LKERFTHGELDCFLGVGDGDNLKENILVDEAARNEFVLFWKTMAGTKIEAFPCF